MSDIATKPPKADFKPAEFPVLGPWSGAGSAENMGKIQVYAESAAQTASNWYFYGRNARRIYCRACRFAAIVLTAAAGIIPMLNQEFPIFKPLYATVCIAVAALLLALDRFWGYTTGWVRYIQTGQQISTSLETFRFEFVQSQIAWTAGGLMPQQIEESLTRVRSFVLNLHQIVQQETAAWAAEFATVLSQMDDQVKTAAQAKNDKGLVQVNVTNGDQSEGGWTIEVDGRSPEQKTGKQTVLNMESGLHQIRIKGAINGKQAVAEIAVQSKAGEACKAEATLA